MVDLGEKTEKITKNKLVRKLGKNKDTKVDIKGNIIAVSGKLGALEKEIPSNWHIIFDIKEESIELSIYQNKIKDCKEGKRILGLCYKLLYNMITGVNNGFEKKLQIIGIGYKVLSNIPGVMELELGFSHAILFPLPKSISYDITEDKSSNGGLIISIKGIDNCLVGQVASLIKDLRPVEPYKGKGIRYFGEVVKLKEKKATK